MVQATGRSTMTIKWKLNQLMFDRGIKSKDLIEATGFHANTVSKLKNLREMPDRLERETLDKICKALGVQPGELLVFEPDEASDGGEPPSGNDRPEARPGRSSGSGGDDLTPRTQVSRTRIIPNDSAVLGIPLRTRPTGRGGKAAG